MEKKTSKKSKPKRKNRLDEVGCHLWEMGYEVGVMADIRQQQDKIVEELWLRKLLDFYLR